MRAGVIATALLGANAVRMAKHKVSSCGAKGLSTNNEVNMSIVNGEDADECEWKWQVGFYSMSGSGPFCGGTLITPEWVLSAAHCMGNSNFQIKAGDWKTNRNSGNEQIRTSAEVYPSPYYNSNTMTHDYALIKVDQPFVLNACVGTACLPTGDIVDGSECFITGWGTLRSGGSQPTTLQEAAVNIISNSDCTGNYGYSASEIDSTMICAQGRTSSGAITDACQGDSGGPLVCNEGGNWIIHGATSWGYGCAGANHPGVWARVWEVMDWIEDTLAGVPQPTTPAPPNFVCDDGCDIYDSYVNDGYCDCSGCEDEDSYTCGSCGGCPSYCGGFINCR